MEGDATVAVQRARPRGRSGRIAAVVVGVILAGVVGSAWSGREPGQRLAGDLPAEGLLTPLVPRPAETASASLATAHATVALLPGRIRATLALDGGGRRELLLLDDLDEISGVASLAQRSVSTDATIRLTLIGSSGRETTLDGSRVTLPPSIAGPGATGCVVLVTHSLTVRRAGEAPPGMTYSYRATLAISRDATVLTIRLVPADQHRPRPGSPGAGSASST